MAQMFAECSSCKQSKQVTFLHEFTDEYPCLCHACLGYMRDKDAPAARDNAANMDEFYIFASIGVDWETGEVIDMTRFISAYEDEQFYGAGVWRR